MSTSVDDPMFDIEPCDRLVVGSTVTVVTMWGDEQAEVLGVHSTKEGFPVASLKMAGGDIVDLSVGRVRR